MGKSTMYIFKDSRVRIQSPSYTQLTKTCQFQYRYNYLMHFSIKRHSELVSSKQLKSFLPLLPSFFPEAMFC